uniref:Zinc finger, C3HC4 type (RING finger)/Ring finger domain/Anaphase-promoting complex subunit 11 RING-H2 finger containing protein, putative n=1 Tax=Theileria annulata TaxID=5874 RepID=A0A3B0MW09_THEAN
MESWEFPFCIICYDRLLSNLTLLPTCGHIFHSECLNTWFDRLKLKTGSCPLCRTSVNINKVIPLNYSISRSDSNENSSSSDENKEYDHLRHQLSQASSDNLDLSQKIQSLKTENDDLQSKLKEEISLKEALTNENKDLKFTNEKNITTINGLANKVIDLNEKLTKFSHVSRYLENQNIPEAENLKSFLSQFTHEENMNILTSRIVELENSVSDLTERNRKLKNERDETDIIYKKLRMEFIKMYSYFNPPVEEKKIELPGINDDYSGSCTRMRPQKSNKNSTDHNSDHSGQLTPSSYLTNNHPMSPFINNRTKNVLDTSMSDGMNLTPGRTMKYSKIKKVKLVTPDYANNEPSKLVSSHERKNTFIAYPSASPGSSPDPAGIRKPKSKLKPNYEIGNNAKNMDPLANNNKLPSIYAFFKAKDKDNSNII